MSGKAAKQERRLAEAAARGINPDSVPDLGARLRLVTPEEWGFRAEAFLVVDLAQRVCGLFGVTDPASQKVIVEAVKVSLRAGLAMGAVDPVWAQRVLVGSARHRRQHDPNGSDAEAVLAQMVHVRRQIIARLVVPTLMHEDWPTIQAATADAEQAA